MEGRPTGTVTFLFTDIEGSTRRWESEPEQMRTALERHDAIVREAVARHDGFVFATGGDGFAIAFARAGAALACAADTQQALGGARLPMVRMALHTGEADERGGDYFGPTVNRAARLMAVGHGGQILLSSTTASLAGDLDVLDLGEHRLRDLSRAEHVFQLVAAGLPVEFPPLRSLDTLATNLPIELTSFVGRVDEMKEVAALLGDHRVVTITGAGGVGKTRLALQISADAAAGYRDGVWFCELAPADDGAAVVEIVAVVLGVSSGPALVLDSIIELLRAKHLLLVLDNCEHVLDAASTLTAAIARGCPRVTVLATSREGLGVRGEQLWPLRSLTLPDPAAPLAEILANEAVRLFVDRARAVEPTFEVDASTAGPVVEVCRRLDCLPLALELAAARIGTLSPSELAAVLDERFRVLTAGRRREVDRHQTLRATVDWSYSMLDEVDRTVFDRLGVFAGSFDAAAAQAVAGDDAIDRFVVLDALANLVAKSMLTVERSDDGRTRYQLLETLRQYASEQLAPDDAEQLRRRHAAHYAVVAEAIGEAIRGADEIPQRQRAIVELDNMRSAMSWALDSGGDDRMLAVRTMAALSDLVSTFRAAGLGAWAERCVPAAREAPPGLRFAVLGGAAFSATIRADHESAAGFVEEAFRDGIPDTCPQRTSAYMSRLLLLSTRDLGAAVAAALESVDELAATGDEYSVTTTRAVGGMYAALGGDTEAGREHTALALDEARALGTPTALAIALFGWALARWDTEPEAARAAIEESLAWSDAGASDVIYADALELLARINWECGDVEGALASASASLRRSVAVGNRPSIASSQWYLAEALGTLGRGEEYATVLAGIATCGASAGLVPAVAGREAERWEFALASLRARLGDERFEELVARGAQMNHEDAVDFTLDGLDRIADSGVRPRSAQP